MTWPYFVDKNGKTTNLSTNPPDFMDRCVILLCVSTKTGVFMDKVAELMVLSMKRDVFMDERIAQKRDTLERMSMQYVHCNKALQRRVIRVSEMFTEHRSSGDARSDRRE